MLQNLKLLREEMGISQAKLADAIGSTQQSINKYEHTKTEPDIETMIRIARFFDTSVDFLVGNTEIRHKIEAVHSFDLNEEEQAHIDYYRHCNKSQRDALDIHAKSYLSEKK